MGIFNGIFATVGVHIVDRLIKKYVTDQAELTAWNNMMLTIQKNKWISGSTPSEYENADKGSR